MLPKEFTDLVDGFIRVYDSEHPMPIELRKAHNSAAASIQSSGQGYHIGSLVPYLANNLVVCLEERGQFLLEKFKVILTSTGIEFYPDLSGDLKSRIAAYFNPALQAAESYLEQMRISGNVPTGYTVETKRAFDNILLKINAELDLFCASCLMKTKIQNTAAKAANPVFNIGAVYGGVGDIRNSPITVNPEVKLNSIIDEHEKQVADRASHVVITKTPSEPQKVKSAKCVFVVHGRNMALRDSMFAFLRAVGLQPLEWSQAVKATGEASPYIGHVLDTAFSMAQAVVVLMTPDDEAYLRKEFHTEHDEKYEKQPTPQARPNVLFEAGMAMGRDARRTVLVQISQLRPFSDISGRHVLRLNNTCQTRQELTERLKTAGCDVNLNGTDWHTVGSFELSTNVKSEIGPSTNQSTPDQATSEWSRRFLQIVAGLKIKIMRLSPGDWYPDYEIAIVEIAQSVAVMPKSIAYDQRKEISSIIGVLAKMTDSQVVYGGGEVFAMLEKLEALVNNTP